MQPDLHSESAISDQIPRPVKRTPAAVATRVLLFLQYVAAVLIYQRLAVIDIREASALKSHGLVASAAVTDKYVNQAKTLTYSLEYHYSNGPISLGGSTYVDESVYDSTDIGDPLTITYLPSDPSIYCAGVVSDRTVRKRLWAWIGWGIAVFVVLG